MRQYPIELYDEYLCMKVPLGIKLTILYSVRHMLLIPLAYLPIFGADLGYLKASGILSPWFVLTDIAGLAVLLAWLRRSPDAHVLWKKIWLNGRVILTFGLLVQFLLVLISDGGQIWSTYRLSRQEHVSLVSMFLSLLAMYYLWRIAAVGEVFSCFPEAGVAGHPNRKQH